MSPGSRFVGKSVLVSGGGTGIGRTAAEAMAREGASVCVLGRRRERLEETVAAIQKAGGKARLVVADVSRDADVAAAISEAAAPTGRLDILVNSAGIVFDGPITKTPPDMWDNLMSVNVRGPFNMCRRASEVLAQGGAIVNVSSAASKVAIPSMAAYCVTKAAVDMMTECLALELGPRGIRVNTVNPGLVMTDFFVANQAISDFDTYVERTKKGNPLGRIGTPTEIAALILFLASDDAGWITGAHYSIDGGRGLLQSSTHSAGS